MKRVLPLFLAVAVLFCAFCACEKDGAEPDGDNETAFAEAVDYSALDLEEYIELGDYSGLTVEYTSDGHSREEALWDKVISNSVIKAYPEKQVEYYLGQKKAQYRYLAKSKGIGYEELLEAMGLGEDTLLEESRALVIEDMVFYSVVRAEKIEISDGEKESYFDRYAEKFAKDYNYTENYVKENMAEQIYEAMLYDKTTQKLMTLNEFVLKGQ